MPDIQPESEDLTPNPTNSKTNVKFAKIEFLKMKLNPGVSKLNILSYFLLCLINYIGLQFSLGFISFILRDPNYYNVAKDDVGTVLGQVGFYAELLIIALEMFVGPIFDLFGRKKVIVLGQIVSGFALFAFPLFKKVWPWFFVCKSLTNMGTTVTLIAPLTPDYFGYESLGLAGAFVQVSVTLGQIISSSFIPSLNSNLDDIKWVFYIVGILTLLCSIVFVFGIKEIVTSQRSQETADELQSILPEELPLNKTKEPRKQEGGLAFLLQTVWHELRTDVQYSLAILILTSSKLLVVTMLEFSPVYLTNVYENNHVPDADKQAQRDLSTINFFGPIASLAVCFVAGPLADKYKIYKLMFVLFVFLTLGGALFLIDMKVNYQKKIGLAWWIGYYNTQFLFPTGFLLANTLLAKVCNPKTRGTMFAFAGLLGSVAIALLNMLSAKTFAGNNMLIFVLAFGNFLIVLVLILVLGISGRLKL